MTNNLFHTYPFGQLNTLEYLNWLVKAYSQWLENAHGKSPEYYTLRWKRKFENEIERIAIELIKTE